MLKGTIRDFNAVVGGTLIQRLREVVAGVAAAYGVEYSIEESDSYPSIINAEEPTALVTSICTAHLGAERVLGALAPMSGAEDFSYFAQKAPGCFVFLGGGDESTAGCPIAHQGGYNYNDKVTGIAMALWVKVVEARFGVSFCGVDAPSLFPALPPVSASALDAFVRATRD